MSTSANVQKYSKNEHGHVEYFIKVFYNGKEWCIWKRYRDFVKFDELLQRDYNISTYKLPARRWWNRYDPELLNYRMKELQTYLNILLRSAVPTNNSLVKEFLEVDEHMLHDAKKLSSKEFNHIDRAKAIVKQTRLDLIQIPAVVSCPSPGSASGSTSMKRKVTISRGPSLGTSFTKVPSFTAWSLKRTDSRDPTTMSLSISPAGREPSRLQSLDFMRTMSMSGTASSFQNENQAAVAEVGRIEAFLSNAERVYQRDADLILHHITSSMISTTLPRGLYNDYDAKRLLYQSPKSLISAMNNIMDEEINRIIEISPKTVLALGSQVVHPFRQPPANLYRSSSDRPVLRRSQSVSSPRAQEKDRGHVKGNDQGKGVEAVSGPEDQDSSIIQKRRIDLRLRRTPSGFTSK
jgi:hypothetical protein